MASLLSLVTNQSLGPSILVVAARQLMGDQVEPWRKFIATNVPRWANIVDGTVCRRQQSLATLERDWRVTRPLLIDEFRVAQCNFSETLDVVGYVERVLTGRKAVQRSFTTSWLGPASPGEL